MIKNKKAFWLVFFLPLVACNNSGDSASTAVDNAATKAATVKKEVTAAAKMAPKTYDAVADALSAATAKISAAAAVHDWEGNILREGTNGYTCLPRHLASGAAAMCLDEPWAAWADAWQNKTDLVIDRIGISYMLAGDGSGSSNTDPYATEKTPDNDWVVEGPHLMIVVPDTADLEGLSTDPYYGGPYVMWKGTPYAHIMIPVGATAAAKMQSKELDPIADALRAGPSRLAANAAVADWEGNILREGTNGYTCLAANDAIGAGAMCGDAPWDAWSDGYNNKTDVVIDRLGISYMLAGDNAGASNIEPYATEQTDDNVWVVEGPHLMVIVPNAADLEGLSTDPNYGGPYVMWKGTPYAHIMIPVNE